MEKETMKELEDFAVRFSGALTGAAEAATTEIIARTNPDLLGKFPYNQLAPFLAPNDNLIVGGLSIPPWVIGYLIEEDAEKKGDSKTKATGEAIRKFGEGDVCYSLSMVLHHSLLRMIPGVGALEARVRPGGRR